MFLVGFIHRITVAREKQPGTARLHDFAPLLGHSVSVFLGTAFSCVAGFARPGLSNTTLLRVNITLENASTTLPIPFPVRSTSRELLTIPLIRHRWAIVA